MKLNIPPNAPLHPPKALKKRKAERGAQMMSPNSPKKGNHVS
jgi:hypothetical protein